MVIALYKTHAHLPFLKKSGKRIAEAFNPEVHGQKQLALADGTLCMRESPIWPVLMSLYDIESHLTAHVSAFCECHGENRLHFSRQTRIQIGDMVVTIDPEKICGSRDSWRKFFRNELRSKAY